MATIKDVAAAAGVSTASVSRALSDPDSVSPKLRNRVQAAAAKLNYRPSALGRALRTRGSNTIGLVVSDILNPFFTELARAVEDAARESGYAMIIGNADESPVQQDHYVRILLERQLEGLIVVPTIETSELLQEAITLGRHIILVDRPATAINAPLIAARTDKAMAELVNHLVATGRKDLAIITGPSQAGSARERLASFLTAITDCGLAIPENRVLQGDFRRSSGYQIMNKLLDSKDLPDAIVVSNGPMTMGVLESLKTYPGLVPQIPRDLALASVDDLSAFGLVTPEITAIPQPTKALGEEAFRMLIDAIEGRKVANRRIDCQLELRASTAPGRRS